MVTGIACTPSKHSRSAYSGLVPMSPKTTPRAERTRTPVRERRCEVTAPSVLQNGGRTPCYHRPGLVRPPPLLLAVLLVHPIGFAISAKESGEPAVDFDRYYEIAAA